MAVYRSSGGTGPHGEGGRVLNVVGEALLKKTCQSFVVSVVSV
jgi:hypothetical protein